MDPRVMAIRQEFKEVIYEVIEIVGQSSINDNKKKDIKFALMSVYNLYADEFNKTIWEYEIKKNKREDLYRSWLSFCKEQYCQSSIIYKELLGKAIEEACVDSINMKTYNGRKLCDMLKEMENQSPDIDEAFDFNYLLIENVCLELCGKYGLKKNFIAYIYIENPKNL